MIGGDSSLFLLWFESLFHLAAELEGCHPDSGEDAILRYGRQTM